MRARIDLVICLVPPRVCVYCGAGVGRECYSAFPILTPDQWSIDEQLIVLYANTILLRFRKIGTDRIELTTVNTLESSSLFFLSIHFFLIKQYDPFS